jgi:hypothetical protein
MDLSRLGVFCFLDPLPGVARRKLAVLDIVPTYEQFLQVDRHSARGGYH